MRILDKDGIEIESPDMNIGYLKPETVFLCHHPEVKSVDEVGHYEVVSEYPNGGKDLEWVVDIEGVEHSDAWDEYETIQRYVEYTPDELAAFEAYRNAPSAEDRIAELEEALELLLSGVTE